VRELPKDQKRALGDLRCAARKLQQAFEDAGMENEADRLANAVERVTRAVANLKRG